MRKIAVIGATSDIATACCRLWAGSAPAFFLVGRDREKLEAQACDLRVRGAAAVDTWTMDANDLAAHPSMVAAAVRTLGSIDIAMIAHGSLASQAACEADVELGLREFATNGTSVIALLTLLANEFEKQRSGAIAVITSVAGDRGRPSNYFYGSAKAAVSVYCEGLRARLFRTGVTVTDIRPGFVATTMTRNLKFPPLLVARPEAVARQIVAGIARRKEVLYTPSFWALIMLVVRNIPRPVFKRMTL
jgi:short-subunit dehydrogenase